MVFQKSAPQKKSNYYIAVLNIIAISIFLRFFLLSNQSLWFDEGWSLRLSDATNFQENLLNIVGRETGDKYQPVYYLLLFYWRSAFGDSEFAIRSLSALLGVGSVITIFLTTLRIYGKRHAYWSSLIIAMSAFSIFYSQDARPYALLIFLASLQLYFFTQTINEDKNKEVISRFCFGIVSAIGISSSILIGLFSLALCLSHLIVYRNFRRWIQWWITVAVFSSPIIWFYLSSRAVADPTATSVTRSGFPLIQNAVFVIYGLLVGTSYGPPMEKLRGEDRIQVVFGYWPLLLIFLVVITVIVLCLVTTFLKQWKSKKYQQADYLFATLFITSFLISLLFAGVTKINWLPRHAFYLYLPMIILIPSAFLHNYKPQDKPYSLSVFAQIAVIFLLIMNLYSGFQYYFNADYAKDDYRSAVNYLLNNRDEEAKSILLWGDTRTLQYYGDQLTLDGTEGALKKINGTNLAEKVSKLTNNVNTVFIVVNREFFLNLKEPIKNQMSDLYTFESQTSFPYINIYRFTKKK